MWLLYIYIYQTDSIWNRFNLICVNKTHTFCLVSILSQWSTKIFKQTSGVGFIYMWSVAILRGGLGGSWRSQIFAWPPSFFLILRSFGWHMQGCQMRFAKIPAILSTAPYLSCIVICKRHMKNISIAKPQLLIACILAHSLLFGVCVTCQSHQRLCQQQQINFAEGSVLTRFTTRVIIIRETMRWFFLKLRQIIFTLPAADTDFQNTGLC